MTKEEFVAKSEERHGGGSYGYDRVPNSVGSNEKVEILCYKHGYFVQRASAHYSQGQQCPECAKEHLWDKRSNERLDTKRFIERAKAIWNEQYDYSLVNCKNAKDYVTIICPIHGAFEKQASNHLNGQGCPKCAMLFKSLNHSLGNGEIIRRCKKTHGNKYDYSLVDADRVVGKIKIICPIHGVFEQIASHHINGSECPKCSKEKVAKSITMTQDEFIGRAKTKHDGFYLYNKTVFVSTKEKIIVTCPIHGDFETIPSNHLQGGGCPKCAREKNGLRCRNTQENFVKRAKEVHGDKYSYDKAVYKTLEESVIITCPTHGDFLQTPTCHLHGNGCPKCHRSKGEEKIALFLEKNNISYEIQKKVENLNFFGGRKYFLLDFYLSDNNVIIEYNGEHHYKPVEWFGGERNFELQKMRDESLRIYCEDHKIKLIEIPYTEFDNIEKILTKELKINKKNR